MTVFGGGGYKEVNEVNEVMRVGAYLIGSVSLQEDTSHMLRGKPEDRADIWEQEESPHGTLSMQSLSASKTVSK